MSDRRPPGFNVDLGFYDSQEVLSIPRKIRAAAVGVWTLAGAYSASKLTDGVVPDEKLRELGCTPAIRAALMATEPEPLWEDIGGAVRFTRWAKWQRTNAEVKAYREADAERKRRARAATSAPRGGQVPIVNEANDSHVAATCASDGAHMPIDSQAMYPSRSRSEWSSTSHNEEMSERTEAGRPQNVRSDSGNPRGRARARQSKSESKSDSSLLTLVEGGLGGDPQNLPVAADAAPANARGKRLDRDWIPSDKTIAAMREEFPALDLKSVHTEFIDYWCAVPGAKGRKTDWDATWRNRCREIAARQRLPARNGNAPPRLQGADLKAAQFQAMKGES